MATEWRSMELTVRTAFLTCARVDAPAQVRSDAQRSGIRWALAQAGELGDNLAVAPLRARTDPQRARLRACRRSVPACRASRLIAAAKCKPVHHLSDLIDQLEQVGIGHKIKLTVTRNDQSRTVEADVVDSGHNGRRSERQDAGAGPFVVSV